MTKLRNDRQLSMAALASMANVALDTIAKASAADACPWKPSTRTKVFDALHAAAPMSPAELREAIDAAFITESQARSPRYQPQGAPEDSDEQWYAGLVARVGPEMAPSLAKAIRVMTEAIMLAKKQGQVEISPTPGNEPRAVKMTHPTGVTTYTPLDPPKSAKAAPRKARPA